MSNAIRTLIEQITTGTEAPQEMLDLIPGLEAKEAALVASSAGPDAYEEVVHDTLAELLSGMVAGIDSADDVDDDEEAFLAEAATSVREALNEEDLHFHERQIRNDVVAFEFGATIARCRLNIHIYVEVNPRCIRIQAVLPTSADQTFDYPLCKAIAKLNYPKRYGALQYDERDGEVCYEYSYPITHGVFKDDFKMLFGVVTSSATDEYKMLRNYCAGKFSRTEVRDILIKVNDLVNELNDDE